MGLLRAIGRGTAVVGLGYLLGTIPSADAAARLAARGTDLRHEGSGNPGATNVAKLVGPGWGAAVMVADIGKGFAAGRVGALIAAGPGANAAATAAVAGHCYPIWTGFRGGKGVATSVGQVLSTFPAYFPLDFVVGASTAANPRWKHRTFAANTAASTVWVFAATVWWRRRLPNLWGPQPDVGLPLAAIASSIMIYHRFHRAQQLGEGSAPSSGSPVTDG